MNLKPISFLLPIILIFLLFGCNKEDNEKIYTISGTVQKGPFINGSEIVVYELNSSFTPTGRSFHGSITNLGKFEVNSVPLVSSYVELVASGFYFNEVTGEISSAPITLSAIVDLSENEHVNVNILTNLEYRRIKYLIKNENISFNEAQQTANAEIANLFTFENGTLTNPELLDISQPGDDNAFLLAISAILQGNYSAAEMSKNVSDIITDMEIDGTLDSPELKSILYTQTWLLNTDQIRANIIANYKEFGIELTSVNNFAEKIASFKANAGSEFQFQFQFPESTEWGPNVLYNDSIVFQVNTDYSLAVEMPSSGIMTIKFQILEGSGVYYYRPLQSNGFTASPFDITKRSQVFTSTTNGGLISVPLRFEGYGVASLQLFYNDVEISLLSRKITWGGYNDRNDYDFPAGEPYGINLLALSDSCVVKSGETYLLSVWPLNDQTFTFNFDLEMPENANVEVVDGWTNQTYSINGNLFHVTLNNIHGSGTDIIMFKFDGEGVIQLSSDFTFNNGSKLARIFNLTK